MTTQNQVNNQIERAIETLMVPLDNPIIGTCAHSYPEDRRNSAEGRNCECSGGSFI